ncbi:hypothetical protein LP421_13615 [Rhizobium sp. RCAM05350]|nr:hypothetical protein LP421_13615 [Rhizobium sp. RCAM05350]
MHILNAALGNGNSVRGPILAEGDVGSKAPQAVIPQKKLSTSPFKLFMKAFWVRNGFPLYWELASVAQRRWLYSERYF